MSIMEFFKPKPTDMQRLRVINDQVRTNGIAVVGTHPDDEAYEALPIIREALDNNISATIIHSTHGEKGISAHMKGTTPEQMANIRAGELFNASKHLGFGVVVLGHPDSEEQDHEKQINDDIAYIIRTLSPGLIIATHPYEMTPLFEHRGHRIVGNAASLASQTADIPYIYDETYPVMDFRPGLLLWTTNLTEANRYRKLTREMREWRNNYLATYHPSQFPRESMKNWSKYFDTISYQRWFGHVDLYKWIR